MATVLEALYENVIRGMRTETEAGVRRALETNVPPETILNEGLVAAMTEVGRRFEAGDYYVPEMLIAARAMQAGMALLKPYLVEKEIKATGKVIIGTVKGDLHDIGKNLVAMMLEGAGFEVFDLGTDVSPEEFVASTRENCPDVVAMSALLTTTMQNMKSVIEALEEAGLRSSIQVIVGGAPVTPAFAQEIRADGFAPDASSAVTVAKRMV
jgi:5-methyltetrahydrofolate--homocysteine methyltransferase